MRMECEICETPMQSMEELSAHMVYHDPADRVVCRQCGYESLTLKQHRQHSPCYFACQWCGKQFNSLDALTEHACLKISIDMPFKCACGTNFHTYNDIINHVRGPKPMYCCSCDEVFDTITELMQHISVKHKKRSRLACSVCFTKFSTRKLLRNHISSEHPIIHEKKRRHMPKMECKDCGKKIPGRLMEAHQAKHHVSCLCPECGKIVESPLRLAQHISQHFMDPVTCDICSKVLKTKKILAEHLKTHLITESGARVAQAVCPHCGIELAQKGSLQRHIAVAHEKERKDKKEVPRTCEKCGITLASNAKYYVHMRQHRAEMQEFVCDTCSRVFNKRHNLIRHMYLVHDDRRNTEKPGITCGICTKQFRDVQYFARHCRTVHKLDGWVNHNQKAF